MNRKTVWATVSLILAMLAGVGLFGFTSAASVPAPAAATPAPAPTAAAPAAAPAPAPTVSAPAATPAPAPTVSAPAATPAPDPVTAAPAADAPVAQTPAPTAAPVAATPAATPDPAAALTVADAKAAAFRHAGCAEADVLDCEAYLDYDDGVPECWKVDFCWNGEEYEYELSCHDCSVLEWDHEPCGNHSCPHLRAAAPAAAPDPDPAAAFTPADAKAAAFRHAGCAEADVLDCEAYLDYDDGVPEYWKVDFCWNGEEYEYELSCHDCSVLKWDCGPCDDHPHPALHHQESHHGGHHGGHC